MPSFRRLQEMHVEGKTVLVRVDFNVPMHDDVISDDTRLRAALPTIKWLRQRGAKVVLLSHFGRPLGQRNSAMSLAPIAPALAALIGAPVAFADDCVGPVAQKAIAVLAPGGVLLLENTRFHPGEASNDVVFAAQLASLGDIFVNDAFSCTHRAHASTEALARLLPSCAGLALARELDHLDQALGHPQHPVLAVVGGAKVSTKIDLLKNLVNRVDTLCVGGGMANTFLYAMGKPVGASLYEADLADTARQIMANAAAAECTVLLPVDVVVAQKFAAHADHRVCGLDDVAEGEMILDAGPQSVAALNRAIDGAKTVIWNGPLGAFELAPFDAATVAAARHCALRTKQTGMICVAGGGDTVAALNVAGVANDFSFVSTAGGAFLEWMEGKPLPGLEALTG